MSDPGYYFVAIDDFLGRGVYQGARYTLHITLPNFDQRPASEGSDMLSGDAGNDQLFGQAGGDTLEGGAGADTLNDGSGADTATYAGASSGVTVRLDTGLGYTGEAAGDVLTSVERLTGSAHADTLIGNAGGNLLEGGAGNDNLRGEAGNDTLHGDAGDDLLTGGAGADSLNGGAGFDTATYANTSSGVTARLDSDLGYTGEAAGDTLISIERLIGTGHGDTLIGDAGGNALEGGAGNDDLRGQGGNDTLTGGGGNDTLAGGSGNDRFVFGSGTDQDRITDFAGGAGVGDMIDLSGNSALNSFAQVQAAASQSGAHTLLNLGGSDSLTLESFTAASLHQDDFIF